jgi:hypothetical protein
MADADTSLVKNKLELLDLLFSVETSIEDSSERKVD